MLEYRVNDMNSTHVALTICVVTRQVRHEHGCGPTLTLNCAIMLTNGQGVTHVFPFHFECIYTNITQTDMNVDEMTCTSGWLSIGPMHDTKE